MLGTAPYKPVVLDRAFEDPEAVRAMVPRNGPYWPTLRYVANQAELGALGGDSSGKSKFVMPWFRGDWATGAPNVEGAAEVLANEAFATAAREVFSAEIVRPQMVYVNLMVGIPFAGPAHIDVPAFRGIDRSEYPVWLMHTMNRSGLFEAWRVSIATAVSWLYRGEGGEFDYWADGTNSPPSRIAAPMDNRGVVGDNDLMFHRVAAVGPAGTKMPEGDPLRSELVYDGQEAKPWAIVDEGHVLARHSERDVRISISWKAEVFPDAQAAQQRESHDDDIDLAFVVDRFLEDLAARDMECHRPADAVGDPEFVRILGEAYPIAIPIEA